MQLVDRIVAPWRRPAGGAAPGLAGATPTIVSVILIVVIAGQLAALLWRTLGSSEQDPEGPVPVVATQAPAVDLTAIVNAHLFGVAANSGDPSDAPATSANLTLAGTLAGREPEQGWAIIGASGQPARVYATGASLPGGSKLFAVYPDRVILDRNGSRESLLLPRLSGGAGAGHTSTRRASHCGCAECLARRQRAPAAGAESLGGRRPPPPAAGFCRRVAPGLSRLPRTEPGAIREHRTAAWRPRDGRERRGPR